jgi:signal recognition particle receptor subunit beta
VVVVSYSGKEINAKLVYYGAGLSGKTTNLESIYEAVPDTSRGKMVSMKTQSDRTLFFDLLPLDLGEIMGFKTRFLLYTVPGQVFYNATRKLVLKGADAIVFVADSGIGKMEENKESLANLRANLAEYGLKLDEIPWVIQYNKRDLPEVHSVADLNAELNPGGVVPYFEAVATQGKGVFETFRGVSHLLMEKVTRELRRSPTSGPGSKPGAAAAAAAAAAPAKSGRPTAAPAFNPLLHEAPTPTPAPAPAAPAAPAAAPTRETPVFKTPRPEPAPVQPEPVTMRSEPVVAKPVRQEPEPAISYGRELKLPAEDPNLEKISTVASTRPNVVAPDAGLGSGFERERGPFETFESSGDRPSTRVAEPKPATLPVADGAPAPRQASAPAESELIVPLEIPRGATREIVIRIILQEK